MIERAVPLQADQASAAADGERGAGEGAVGDRGLDDRVDAGEQSRRPSRPPRGGRGEGCRPCGPPSRWGGAGERDRERRGHGRLSGQRARRGALGRGRAAPGKEVRVDLQKLSEEVRIAERRDDGRAACGEVADQLGDRLGMARPYFRSRTRMKGAKTTTSALSAASRSSASRSGCGSASRTTVRTLSKRAASSRRKTRPAKGSTSSV